MFSGIFLAFWSRGQGPVEFGKKHLDHQNWEKSWTAILNGLKTILEISSVKL